MNRSLSKNLNIGSDRIYDFFSLHTIIRNMYLKMDIEGYRIFINALVNLLRLK